MTTPEPPSPSPIDYRHRTTPPAAKRNSEDHDRLNNRSHDSMKPVEAAIHPIAAAWMSIPIRYDE
jgi:hypothetical protein